MPNWNTRLEVRVGTELITPITQFTPNFRTPMQPVNSIEGSNLGYVRQPPVFTFTMSVLAMGPIVAKLTKMALAGEEFEIGVSQSTGTEWTFTSIAFKRCVMTETAPSTVVVDGAPVATFTCTCLEPTVN